MDRILRPDRVYVIDVEMRVPESPNNAALGNWMVQVREKTRGQVDSHVCGGVLVLIGRVYVTPCLLSHTNTLLEKRRWSS